MLARNKDLLSSPGKVLLFARAELLRYLPPDAMYISRKYFYLYNMTISIKYI